MQPDQTLVLSLTVLNVVIFAFFFVGLKRHWENPLLKVATISEAFVILEKSVRRAFPDLPEGFTWGEALSRAKSLNLKKIDWMELERELRKYEAHRYGGEQVKGFNVREIMKLATLLPRGRRFGRRP